MSGALDHALHVEHLSKAFPGIRALDDVSLELRRGEIHALLGGNGSGKSTLLTILAGVLHGDRGGRIMVAGREVASDRVTPSWAATVGLRFVHQQPSVFPDLSVAENLAIGNGFTTGRGGAVNWKTVERQASAVIERFEIDAEPTTALHRLSLSDRTMVTIARALQEDGGDLRVYVLDEPTAALSAPRAQLVYDVLRERRAAGHTVLFVSHRLDEVAAIADNATILRDGIVAATRSRSELDRDELVELIVGRRVDEAHRSSPPVPPGPVVLETRALAGGPVHDVSCSVRRGEILGIAGALGAGRSELLQMLFGIRPVRRGEILLDGRPVVFRDIDDAMRHGIAYVPPDRADATFGTLSLSENLAAASVHDHWQGWRLRRGSEARDARQSADRLAIRASSPEQPMATLSGGNQQKVVLARWLRRAPDLLLLDEPTRGVDVGARAMVHSVVAETARAGAAVVVSSDDFEELSIIADRVLVLVRGRVAAELRHPDVSAAAIGRVAFGATSAA